MKMKKENNMDNKINWKQKLTSRKLWVTIIGIIIGVAMSFGVGESDYGEIAGKVAGAITAISSIIGYIYGESKVDAARIDADEWTEKMKNADGSTGRHWNFEQTEQVRRQHGYDCDPAEFYAAINMMYSDYYKIGKEFNLNSVDFYAAMAHAFLDDEDAGEDKLAKYYECIVEKH